MRPQISGVYHWAGAARLRRGCVSPEPTSGADSRARVMPQRCPGVDAPAPAIRKPAPPLGRLRARRRPLALSQQTTFSAIRRQNTAPNSTHAALPLPASGEWAKDLKNYSLVSGPASKLAPATLSAKA